MSFTPDKFQQRIQKEFRETQNNIVVQAVAGSGKTSTLKLLMNDIPPHKDAIYVAFNKHIVDSLKATLPYRENITISTLNSFGARMLYRTLGKITLVENKYFLIALRLFKSSWQLNKENKWNYCYNISKIVDVMRFNFCFDDEEAIQASCAEYGITILADELEHALRVFEIGMENINQIDFLDQIFLPVVRKIKFIKFHYVLSDEVQDFSKLQHQFVKKLLMPGTGRLVGVGDKNQSIYLFAGASSNSFDAFKNLLPKTIELPLSYCYRCGTEMVAKAKELVPQIESPPNQHKGLISNCNVTKVIMEGHAVVCRNTKPLVILCRDLIRQGKKATIKGREIGENLIILIRKTQAHTINGCLEKIAGYETELRLKLLKKGVYRPDQAKAMIQLVEKKEIIKVLAEQVGTINTLIEKVKQIFVDDSKEGVLCMTIHKSKGGEWPVVWFLNSFLIPSSYAVTEDELIQERNLLYVAITRAKQKLIYIDMFETEEEEEELIEEDYE